MWTYGWTREVSQRIDEKGPYEDGVEECEKEVVDEEADYSSREAFREELWG